MIDGVIVRDAEIVLEYSWMTDCIPAELIKKLRRNVDEVGSRAGRVGNKEAVKPATRVVQVSFPDEAYTKFFTRIMGRFVTDKFGFDVDGFQRLRVLTYPIGGHYKFHSDTATNTALSDHRKITLVAMLSDPDEFEGGAFILRSCGREIDLTEKLIPGAAIAFPSYLDHKVTPVTSGVRQTVVLWGTGPKWR
jgi:predicted 2-oxoglutarate/Fe(II)-dependent dioxygenase YbiX